MAFFAKDNLCIHACILRTFPATHTQSNDVWFYWTGYVRIHPLVGVSQVFECFVDVILLSSDQNNERVNIFKPFSMFVYYLFKNDLKTEQTYCHEAFQ